MNYFFKSLRKRPSSNQKGLASIVIVGVLVILLTIISIGFAKLMNRSINNALNNQLSTAASYAAQSGLNDTISYLKKNPKASATKCNDLLKPGKLGPLADLSGDGNTEYTCILVNQTPKDLVYQNLPPYKSEVVPIITENRDKLERLLFSWQTQSSERGTKNVLPDPLTKTLFDETTWGNKNYEPALRLTLYPVPKNGKIDDVQADSKTFFLYPTSDSSSPTNLDYKTIPDGALIPISCKAKDLTGVFIGTADYDCNVVISNFRGATSKSAFDYFYARLTPLYVAADVKIQANDDSKLIKFEGVEALVDVTGKSGSSAKRLQARVDLNSSVAISPTDDSIPEYALRSAKTICKRLVVSVTNSAVDGTSCDLPSIPPPPPPPPTPPPTPTPPPPGPPTPPPPGPSGPGCSDLAPSRTPGQPDPDPCVRSVILSNRTSATTAEVKVWASHCYGSLTINGSSVSWQATPDDNSSYIIYTVNGLNPGGGSIDVVCTNAAGTASGGTSYGGWVSPPPPTPPCPSPPGSGPCGGPPPPPPREVGGCDWGDGAYDSDISPNFCNFNGGSWSRWCIQSDGRITKGGC